LRVQIVGGDEGDGGQGGEGVGESVVSVTIDEIDRFLFYITTRDHFAVQFVVCFLGTNGMLELFFLDGLLRNDYMRFFPFFFPFLKRLNNSSLVRYEIYHPSSKRGF